MYSVASGHQILIMILKFICFLDFTMHVTGHATQIPGFLYLYFTIVAKTRQVLVTFYKVMKIPRFYGN